MTQPNDNAGEMIKSGAMALLTSLIRTLVPLLVGTIVAWSTKLGVPMAEADVATLVNGLVSFGVAALYYLVARLLEMFASSKFGWLLGFAKAPAYQVKPAIPPATPLA